MKFSLSIQVTDELIADAPLLGGHLCDLLRSRARRADVPLLSEPMVRYVDPNEADPDGWMRGLYRPGTKIAIVEARCPEPAWDTEGEVSFT